MDAGCGAGRSFDTEPLPSSHDATGSDAGVDTGQVPVHGADLVAVAEDDPVAVRAAPAGRRDRSGSGGDHSGPGRITGEVLAGVQPPHVIDGMEPAPVRRRQPVPRRQRRPPPTGRQILSGRGGGAAEDAGDHGRGDDPGRDQHHHQRQHDQDSGHGADRGEQFHGPTLSVVVVPPRGADRAPPGGDTMHP